MNRTALWIATAGVLFASAASAADMRMPARAPAPMAPIATYNWSGCYVGAGGGYGMFDQETRLLVAGAPATLKNDVGGRGWFGTVQVGCDYQVGSNIVIGAFGDYDFGNIKGDWTSPGFNPGFQVAFGEEKLKNSWAAGARIGWLPFQQLLVYVSGGYTQARFGQINLVNIFDGTPNPSGVVAKHTYSGWFIGTGYEYGLSFLPGLYWKTEYRFADYGSDTVPFLVNGAPSSTFSFDHHKFVHTVRSELVWRFNWSSPVVARY